MSSSPEAMDRKVRQLDNDVQSIYELLAAIQGTQLRQINRLDELDGSLTEVKSDLGTVKTDLGTVKTDLGTFRTDVGSLRGELGELSVKVDRILGYLER